MWDARSAVSAAIASASVAVSDRPSAFNRSFMGFSSWGKRGQGRKIGQAVKAGVIGQRRRAERENRAVGRVTENGGEVTVFAGGDHGRGTRRPAHIDGIKAIALAPFQRAVPARRRRRLAVGLGVQGLVLEVDDVVGLASGGNSHQARGACAVKQPAGGNALGATGAVGGLETTGGQQADFNRRRAAGRDKRYGENSKAGSSMATRHAATVPSARKRKPLARASGFSGGVAEFLGYAGEAGRVKRRRCATARF